MSAQINFTHVFFNQDPSRPSSATNAAIKFLESRTPPKTKASNNGDYFPYGKSYVDEQESKITRYFGVSFAKSIFSLNSDAGAWQGPLSSTFGLHLIKLHSKDDAFIPTFEQVRIRLAEDARKTALVESRKGQIEQLKSQYVVIFENGSF